MSLEDKHEDTTAYGVAVDMGASHLRFVLADANPAIVHETQERVNSKAGSRGAIAQVRDGIRRLVPQGKRLRGIAVGVPGGVDPKTGVVFDVTNVPGWRDVDMGSELEDEFHAPVFLENDANMAAIGEHMCGIARGISNFVFIALGTGVGAGIFVDGRICRGRSGLAGEIFRMNLDWTRWNEEFRDTGYFETYVKDERCCPVETALRAA